MTYITDEETNKEFVKMGKIKKASKIVKINLDEKPKEKTKKKKKKHLFVENDIIAEKNSQNIENLRKEIKEKERLLELRKKEIKAEKKAKRKAEKKAKRKQRWYFRIFKRKKKQEETKEEINPNPDEIQMIKINDNVLKLCPVCNSKIKREKIKQDNETFRQIFRCKKCPFQKEIIIKM